MVWSFLGDWPDRVTQESTFPGRVKFYLKVLLLLQLANMAVLALLWIPTVKACEC